MTDVWVEATDPKTGKKYYYNKKTHKVTWQREMDAGGNDGNDGDNGGGGGVTSDPASDPQRIEMSTEIRPKTKKEPQGSSSSTHSGSSVLKEKNKKEEKKEILKRVQK